MAKSRLVGSYPVIGIRPTIDGRRGALDVRGSLEEQTMNMAKSAAKLFEENLRYSNGEPVKVVIADTTIGRVGESAACADKFRKEGVDITLTVTPCWCYGAETMDMDPQTIKAEAGPGFHRAQLCFSTDTAAAFCLCIHVTEILLSFLFRDDTSDSYGLSESPTDRTGLLSAFHH